jgi:hypothetical protein
MGRALRAKKERSVMKPFETNDGHSAWQTWSDAAPGAYGYALVKSGPDVDPDEVEERSATSVEVVILWGTTVLHVDHLTPPRSFYVGEGSESGGACDYIVPSEKIGTERAPIVLVENGSIELVVLPQAKGEIEFPGQRPVPIKDMIASGRTSPCDEVPGAVKVSLVSGAKARIEIDGLVFKVAAVPPGKVPAHGLFTGDDTSAPVYVGLSFLAHLGLFAAMAFFVPPLGLNEEEGARQDQRYLIMQYLNSISERERETASDEQPGETATAEPEGGSGTRAKGEEGTMGSPTSTATGHRWGNKGPVDNPDQRIARDVALRDAANFGMIGILNQGGGGDPDAPTAPWGGVDSLGTDPMSARGNMWGADIGEAFGHNGLGLSGIGEGGGGLGEGIGLGAIGTYGHGAGTGTGQGFGPGGNGLSHGHTAPTHASKVPTIRTPTTTVNGRLPAEVIQRIVRQNYGRFRLCYENGLRSNPNLQGRVEVRFVIGRDGAVSNVGNGGSDLPDSGVVKCVLQAYYTLSFPQPENGIVSVVYPIVFSPG